MIAYPHLSPVAFSLGPIQVHWYGLMYLVGFVLAWLLARWRARHYQLDFSPTAIDDIIFYAAMGVIIGGRLGYMIFYNASQWISHPLSIFKLWEGGMSFHGGLLGVIVGVWLVGRRIGKSFLEIGDFIAPLVPLGLAAGRLGNFINGELWGRPADVPWAMVFPHADNLPRHPSQLYEMGLEGIALFVLVWVYASRKRPTGAISGVFLMGYAVSRMLAECFREPDVQLGFLAFDWLTMGQLLSIPMLLAGFLLWWKKR